MKNFVDKNNSFHINSKESNFISGNKENLVLFSDDDLHYLVLAHFEWKASTVICRGTHVSDMPRMTC